MYFSFGDISRKDAKAYLSRKENQIKTLPSRALVWLFPLSSIKLHNHFRAAIILKGFPRKFKLRKAGSSKDMMDLARLLPKLLNATGANPEMAEIAAKVAWSRAAGDGLRRHAIPFRLYRTTLVVSVADTIWQRQMQSMSAELLSRINKLLGREVVETIEFRIDPAAVEKVRARAQPRQGERDEAPKPAPDELISAAGEIADPDLRERFIRAAENCIARRESQMPA